MNIQQAKEEIKNTVRAYTAKDAEGRYRISSVHQRPILLMGAPGIGKTAIMRQAAEELGIGLVEYTLTHHTRQSAVGLPILEKKSFGGKEYTVTEYTMSEILASVYECMEKSGIKEGILFLDEINCVSETLAPTMLQFLQQKKFGTHRLPEGWLIVGAGNPTEYNKAAREFDFVTLDRVKLLKTEADYTVWRTYAVKRGIHRAVCAYLDLKPESFYQVGEGRDGTSFVTARGWEDLSQMMKLYEELGISVTAELIGQYLQKKEIAEGFAEFYRLCREYEEVYELETILEKGGGEQKARLQRAGFAERTAVLSLLEGVLHKQVGEYAWREGCHEKLYEEMKLLKRTLEEETGGKALEELLEERIEKQGHRKEVLKEQGLLSGDELLQAEWLERRLREALFQVKKEELLSGHSIREEKDRFLMLRREFEEESRLLGEKRRKVKEGRERGIRFAAENPELGQEAALFLTRISRDSEIMRFIGAYGCRAYLEHSQVLLKTRREEELKREILALYEEAGEKVKKDTVSK